MSDQPTSSKPTINRASYVWHICYTIYVDKYDLVKTVQSIDNALDLLESDSGIQHITLNSTYAIEDYLTLRPENFERIEAVIREGRLLVSPLYNATHKLSVESWIRNLLIGLRTASIFGRPMMTALVNFSASHVPTFLPQIFRSFEIPVAVNKSEWHHLPSEQVWQDIDGTTVIIGGQNIIDVNGVEPDENPVSPTALFECYTENAKLYSKSGHIIWLEPIISESKLSPFPKLSEYAALLPSDDVFNSHPFAYAKAIEKAAEREASYPIIKSNTDTPLILDDEILCCQLEPFTAWAELLGPIPSNNDRNQHLHNPQVLIQRLWKAYLKQNSLPQNYLDQKQVSNEFIESITVYVDQALHDIAYHINTSLLNTEDNCVVIFNLSFETKSSEVMLGKTTHPVTLPQLSYTTFHAPSFILSEPAFRGVNILKLPKDGQCTLPLSGSLIAVSHSDFQLTAVKLPEESDRSGLIVRGLNRSNEPIWVTLSAWRSFAHVEVVTMDEARTGGILAPDAVANGAVQFRAAPHHLLTFWFHD